MHANLLMSPQLLVSADALGHLGPAPCTCALYLRRGRYSVVATGHSMGGGVAALLTLLLRRTWRRSASDISVRCFAFSPPGGLVSRSVADAMRSFCTSGGRSGIRTLVGGAGSEP